jgi:hypothetical protein
MGLFVFGEFGRNLASLSRQFAPSADRRFEFQKRSHLFIRVHNETLSVSLFADERESPTDELGGSRSDHRRDNRRGGRVRSNSGGNARGQLGR